MKALTIEQLKNLAVGNWVWAIIEQKDAEPMYGYFQKTADIDTSIFLDGRYVKQYFDYSDYGTKWLAYKNKEQAESKGEIVEFPCILKSNSTYPKNQVVYINEFGSIIVERFSYEQDAERRLAELKGE